jgi:general secretion pathway protein N
LALAGQQEGPQLALIGAVVGDSDAFAVFLDRTSKKIIRLRQGETHAGCELNAVKRREVTLRKADGTETIALARAEAATATPAAPPVPGLAIPTEAPSDGSFAPFVTRSARKNGEPDGL